MQDSRFASEEAKLVRTLGLLQLVVLASTLAVVLARASAESALAAYEGRALSLVLAEPAPGDLTLTIDGGPGADQATPQRIRLEQVAPGQLSLQKAVMLLAGNARHHRLTDDRRRILRFEVHDRALGIDLRYAASPSTEDIPLRNAPSEPLPPWDAGCPPRADVRLAVLGPGGQVAKLLPIIDGPYRLLFQASLAPPVAAARPDLAQTLALHGVTIAESRSMAGLFESLMRSGASGPDAPAQANLPRLDPCRSVDTFDLPAAPGDQARSSVVDLSRALGTWKPTLEALNVEYERLRDNRLNEVVKIPVLDLTVPAAGFAWAVIGLALYVGVTISRLARTLAQEDHRVVTAVAQLWPLKGAPLGGADTVAYRLERVLPWLNAVAVAVTPALVAVASAALWAPVRRSYQIFISDGGVATVTFLPIRYLVPYLFLLIGSMLVSWSSCRALWREWQSPTLHEPLPEQATQVATPGFLGQVRIMLNTWKPRTQLKLQLFLAGAAAVYYGDLLLERHVSGDDLTLSLPPLLPAKVVLASAIVLAALTGLARPSLQRTALTLVGTALLATYAVGAALGFELAVAGSRPFWSGPPNTDLLWIFGVLSTIGAYGLWLLVRLRGRPVSRPAGTSQWRWLTWSIMISLLMEAWVMLRMQS